MESIKPLAGVIAVIGGALLWTTSPFLAGFLVGWGIVTLLSSK